MVYGWIQMIAKLLEEELTNCWRGTANIMLRSWDYLA